jgi:hypothetical protein
MGQANKPSTQAITCPDCGLVLRVADDALGFRFVYDMRDWRLICTRVHLGHAAWCLVQRDGTHPLPSAINSCERGDDLRADC